SPTHGNLVELSEAVGIIAGQSIGEPGTQLTLRTFHTGGVFTGGKRVDAWNEHITKILGIPWGFFLCTELTIVQSQISLVNKIQRVYRSQGVHIHNRHIEIIVRQITSKVLVSEDGMSNVFSLSELIGLFRAKRAGRALEEVICYRALLLGITKTSLNTQSFISEASFQETTRVLAKAALRGRIDWLKGLKENVVLGGMIPVSTGFKRDTLSLFLWGSMTKRYWNITLEEMMKAGVHFDHGTRKWNPRMAPYISTKRKGIHILNLTRTARFLSEACDLFFDAAKTRLHKFRSLRIEQKTGRIHSLPKKDTAILKRQLSHLETYLGGIKYMTGLPDIVIIVDQQEEYTALRECITLGIPTICLIDTNCDPDLADISIPVNDDAIASIRLILNKLVFAICEAILVVRNPQTIPTFGQNFFEYVLEFTQDVSKNSDWRRIWKEKQGDEAADNLCFSSCFTSMEQESNTHLDGDISSTLYSFISLIFICKLAFSSSWLIICGVNLGFIT
ncbi:hypothetical protein S245_061317, partial [Arachis hypogaea]